MFLEKIMNTHAKIQPFDLARHAQTYTYDEEKFRKITNRLAENIIQYDPDYGHYLLAHLNRTSRYLEEFMINNGYDADVAKKISTAFRLHDIGKIMQPISLWEHTSEKPDQIKKDKRAEHTMLGKDILFQTIEDLGLTLTQDDSKHISTIIYLQENHHERENGKGPRGLTGALMHPILKMATILDEIDGKIKLDHENLESIFQDIRTRHHNKFDPSIVDACQRYCIQYARFADLSAILVLAP